MNLDFNQVEEKLLSYPQTYLSHPFGEEVFVYKLKLDDQNHKMFAILVEKKEILRLSLKCDPLLAQTLRQKYESVLSGYRLSKKHWNTIILSGQLSWPEIIALIDHSYQLVVENE